MSAFTKPVVVTSGSNLATLLERIPLTAAGGLQASENWLQKALFDNPGCLPVSEIDPNIGPLIAVCMEIETGSGPADILYVTPTGQIVLVETKLWRNPEARREVVGQILDYAKNLTTWTYDTLDQKAGLAAKGGSNFLVSRFEAACPGADVAAFVDGVAHSLRNGDFLLLIVGDGIRAGAESLVTFLEKFGHLRFRLGLVEVAMYPLADGSRLLLPRILAKTELLQRTMLIGPSGPVALQQAAQVEDSTANSNNLEQREWFRAFWSDFLRHLKLDDDSLVPAEPAKSTNQFFPMPPHGGMAWISAYIAQASNKAGVYLTFSKSYDHALDIYELLEADKEAVEKEVGVELSWGRSGDKVFIGVPHAFYTDINSPAERQKVVGYLAEMTQQMIRVMRPRLDAAVKQLEG